MQMKKFMIITLVLAMTITAASCKAKAVSGVDTVPETPKPTQTEVQKLPEDKVVGDTMKLAYEGKMDHLQIGVNDRLKEVVEALGEPMELAHFEGASYISYANVSFMLDKIVEDTSDEAKVTGVIVSEGYELYGVKVGMKPEEIKNILGAGEQEYKDGESEEEMWKLEYNCGDYKLTFFFNDNNSPSTSAYLSKL
ncbi:MAG: hypothetical protein K0Q65_1352 [Clostridia bacterium]|nr:hypothetical protein [Clostridia bacterium]